jgi:hypothetical protein
MPAVLTIRPPAVSPVDYSPSSCEAHKLVSKYPAVNAHRFVPCNPLYAKCFDRWVALSPAPPNSWP